MTSRHDVVRDLVERSGPLDEAVARLRGLSFDSDELVDLDAGHPEFQ